MIYSRYGLWLFSYHSPAFQSSYIIALFSLNVKQPSSAEQGIVKDVKLIEQLVLF